MKSQLRPALVSLVLLTILTGAIYPAIVTVVANVAFAGAMHRQIDRQAGDAMRKQGASDGFRHSLLTRSSAMQHQHDRRARAVGHEQRSRNLFGFCIEPHVVRFASAHDATGHGRDGAGPATHQTRSILRRHERCESKIRACGSCHSERQRRIWRFRSFALLRMTRPP